MIPPRKTDTFLDSSGLTNVISRYAGTFQVSPVSYATVRDYCDSVDHMRCLATMHGDLKNVQRPWMVKAILGTVPRGGRILEIGAGEPWVADILNRAGYDTWVVDPYDGSGNGPVEFARFQDECPAVHFVRDSFSDETPVLPPAMFDCIYSISVLEHLDPVALRALAHGQNKFLKPSGRAIHAVDHILRGQGEQEHWERLKQLCADFRLDVPDPVRIADDLDTYYLSAEGFNQWRGTLPYDHYPMRQCISLQLMSFSSEKNVA